MVLSQSEAADFFPMMVALDAFTNRRLQLVPGLDDPLSMDRASTQVRLQMRNARLDHPEVLEAFVQENPFGLSEGSLADVARLRHAVIRRFCVERALKAHAILITMSGTPVVYAVGGLTRRVEDVLQWPPGGANPTVVHAALLPWRGRIVWDGIVHELPVYLGPQVRRSLRDTYMRAKERGEIVTTLGEPATPQVPKRPARDWRPAVAEIVAAVDKLGKPQTSLQSATFAMLDRSALLAQAALDEDHEAVREAAERAQRALRKVLTMLPR